MTITASTTQSDQEKFLSADLLKRSLQKLVAASLCDKVKQPKGAGLTAYFVRYKRMAVPLVALTEGTDPANSDFALDSVSVTLDQWGDVITLTDVAELTTSHPLLQQAQELLAENAARVIDREIQLVWLAGTNVFYGDGSVTSRANITSGMKMSDTVMNKVRVSLADAGVPPRGGPSGGTKVSSASTGSLNAGKAYVAVCGPQVTADIMGTTTWVAVAQYANQKALYNAEVGTWLGIRFVETNFIPKFNILGNTTAAVSSGSAFGTNTPTVTTSTSGGTLPATTAHFFRVTRKNKERGFEEDISIDHSMSTGAGATNSFAFAFTSLTAGYVYNLYIGTAAGDANLKLVQANIEVGTTVTVTAVPGTGSSPPAVIPAAGTFTVHPVYVFGEEACNWVSLQEMRTYLSGGTATTDNPLALRRKLGYKFLAKAMIRDQTRILRIELASAF